MKDSLDKGPRREALQWPDGCNDLGVPKAKFGNTRTALQAAKVVVRFNNFRQQLIIEGHGLEGEASDHSVSVLRSRIYDAFGFNPNTDDTYQALIDIGRQHMFNPVVDWLNEQKWDGTKRAERLFVDYLGAADTALHHAFARKLLCAMVKRVQEPGVKFDFMVILEGPQDVGKSLFCADLAVRSEWFNDAPVLNRDSKAQMEAVEGKWVIEAAELQGIGKAEVEKVKSFITRTHDRERRAYGRFRAEVGRTCVIIGTTNETAYLKDMTGNRRFWPVAVEKYDQAAFLRDREQIFAEAVTLAPTERLWLDDRKLYAAAIRA